MKRSSRSRRSIPCSPSSSSSSKNLKNPKKVPSKEIDPVASELRGFFSRIIKNPAPYPPHSRDSEVGICGNLTPASALNVIRKIREIFERDNSSAISGSVSPLASSSSSSSLPVKPPINFLDIGSGEGCMIVACMLYNHLNGGRVFGRCDGVEICDSVANYSRSRISSYFREKKLRELFANQWSIDILNILHCSLLSAKTNCVYAFWTGMPPAVVAHIVALCLRSNVRVLAVSLLHRLQENGLGDIFDLLDFCRDPTDNTRVKLGSSSFTFLFYDLSLISEEQSIVIQKMCDEVRGESPKTRFHFPLTDEDRTLLGDDIDYHYQLSSSPSSPSFPSSISFSLVPGIQSSSSSSFQTKTRTRTTRSSSSSLSSFNKII